MTQRILFSGIEFQKQLSEELDAVFDLLENICYRCPDRSDYRVRVADCVFRVVGMLPEQYRFVSNILIFVCLFFLIDLLKVFFMVIPENLKKNFCF